ncbi:uncharacterized protein J3R85_019019 [Psidium guajava]|nr:uncharacterized protein J3R85_019019 [Psidium guajava]
MVRETFDPKINEKIKWAILSLKCIFILTERVGLLKFLGARSNERGPIWPIMRVVAILLISTHELRS